MRVSKDRSDILSIQWKVVTGTESCVWRKFWKHSVLVDSFSFLPALSLLLPYNDHRRADRCHKNRAQYYFQRAFSLPCLRCRDTLLLLSRVGSICVQEAFRLQHKAATRRQCSKVAQYFTSRSLPTETSCCWKESRNRAAIGRSFRAIQKDAGRPGSRALSR